MSMLWDELYIAGVGAFLPPPVSTDVAVAAGHITDRHSRELGYTSVLVSDGPAPAEMAVAAGRAAVAQSGLAPAEFGQVLHSTTWFQGRMMWPTATYVANETLGTAVPGVELQQRCNGGMASLELGAAFLAGRTRGSAVLLTTGDRFSEPAINRWNSHSRTFFGDGGTAMVLARGGGFARVLSTVTLTDNLFEGAARGTAAFDECPPPPEETINLAARHKEFIVGKNPVEILPRIRTVLTSTWQTVLAECDAKMDDVRRVIEPASHSGASDDEFAASYGCPLAKSTWEFGRTTGHLGSGDQFAGLDFLVRTKQVAEGDLVLLIGGGTGYTCTAALIEIQAVPDPVPAGPPAPN
ncbi:ketoacyl-ACP synthase III family protein [Dactylosporangium sp. CA-233914]|uniref:ketoacyl-ACP synthase III family protein n=1 Tax=Dactylosporangium sp. CA-233914 TaxID=3239934 RepID=UPI003D89D08F